MVKKGCEQNRRWFKLQKQRKRSTLKGRSLKTQHQNVVKVPSTRRRRKKAEKEDQRTNEKKKRGKNIEKGEKHL